MKEYVKNDLKPNYAALARQYGVDYRTAKRAYTETKNGQDPKPSAKRISKLDEYKETIDNKLDLNCSAMAIFKFIQKKGFTGQYTIVRDYCAKIRRRRIHKATQTDSQLFE